MRKAVLLCLGLCLCMPFTFCIFAGEDVQGGNHSFVVSLQSKQSLHFCCGSLITSKFVLTAASCVKDRRPQDLIVVGGITNLDDRNGIHLLIDKIISMTTAGPKDVRKNIALMSLMEDITKSERLHPISLAQDDQEAKVGDPCRIYGWGKKSKTAPETTNTLQTAVTKIGNHTECLKDYGDVNGTLICMKDGEASLCQYDTGSPLISDQGYYLWGISTGRHRCGDSTDSKSRDVYTRVDSYKEWIWKVVQENSASTERKRQTILTGIVALLMIMLN